MVDTSKAVGQADAALDQVVGIVSQDVPNAIDDVQATIPPTAKVTQDIVSNIGGIVNDTGITVGQAGAALNQVVGIASQDVPNAIEAVHAEIPPTANVTKDFLGNVEQTMADASETVAQTGQALDQVVVVASQGVPDTMDQLVATAGPAAETTQSLLNNVEATMQNTRGAVNQTEMALDQTTQLVGRLLPETIDEMSATVPLVFKATEGNLNDTLAMLKAFNYLDQTYRVQMDAPANDLTQRLDNVSSQLRGIEKSVDYDFSGIDQSLVALSQDVTNINSQINQLTATVDQLQLLSDQLRQLESVSDNNNLDQVSEDILLLSQSVGAINSQVDNLVAATDQLKVI